jgi:hypothetical protein
VVPRPVREQQMKERQQVLAWLQAQRLAPVLAQVPAFAIVPRH